MLPYLPPILAAMHRPSREAHTAALDLPRERPDYLTRERPELPREDRERPTSQPSRPA